MRAGMAFIVWDGLRALLGAVGRWAVWSVAIAAVLLAGTAVVLLPGHEEARQPETQLMVLAYMERDLSEDDINRLAWEAWRWPEVTHQGFRFVGENEPKEIQRRALVVHVENEQARIDVEERMAAAEGVAGVEQLRRTLTPPPRLPPASRIGALIGLVGSLAASVFLARWSTGAMTARWSNELALLRQTGLRESLLRVPFLAAGALVGLTGAALYLACYWGVWAWAQQAPAILDAAPALDTGGPMATALGILLALLLGMLGGLLGYPARHHHS